MKLVYFTHSLASCWNNGNAHFLRGVLSEFSRRGDEVVAFEPANAWSLKNLLHDHGAAGVLAYEAAYPELSSRSYRHAEDYQDALADADVVIVHEWNDVQLVAELGARRRRGVRFILLFHDTHHRAVSDPAAIRAFDLNGYDGVLAFGETVAEVYRRWGWGRRVWVWHEAADSRRFQPSAMQGDRAGLVWIGNWGDGERGEELEGFLLGPARTAGLKLDIHGVRYPPSALGTLARYGAEYRGWLPNAQAPEVFNRHLATVHVPRRFYAETLPGIPTIRVFEALACGIPLVCAPWDDCEHLFRPGQDYLVARNGAEMVHHLRALADDAELRRSLVRNGLETIRARHTCAHRVHELVGILATIRGAGGRNETMLAGDAA